MKNILNKIILFSLLNFGVTTVLVFVPVAQTDKVQSNFLIVSPSPLLSSAPASIQEYSLGSSNNKNPIPTTALNNSALCVIVINGQKYDATELRKIHSGGDIFTCGLDMTEIFYSRHDNSYLPKMGKYKLY